MSGLPILTKEQTNSLSYGTAYAIETHTETYYVQDQLEDGPNRLLLAGGYYHHPAFGDHETWNAEYGFAVTSNTLLIASAGTAFRAPSATDRFGFGGTPNLLPESSRDFELGIKSRITESQQVTFSAFQNTINDLIEFVPDPSNLIYGGENQNVDRARIQGLEAPWELRADPWSVRAEASLQDPRNLSADAQDTELLRRSKRSFTVSSGPSYRARGAWTRVASVRRTAGRQRGHRRTGSARWRLPADDNLGEGSADAGLGSDGAAGQRPK